jgi:hypothetical protein
MSRHYDLSPKLETRWRDPGALETLAASTGLLLAGFCLFVLAFCL